MKKEFNYVDIAFVIDTTGSMGAFINQAKKHLSTTLEKLSKKNEINLQVALVEYKDHPPQDSTFITKCVNFTDNFKMVQGAINKLKEGGGGDTAEAVYRGLYDACEALSWRPNSSRFILLVGDAPPHGFLAWHKKMFPKSKELRVDRGGDVWPDGCPSGLDVSSVTAAAEKKGIVIHAICLVAQGATAESFHALAMGTGGHSVNESSVEMVVNKITGMLTDEFQQIHFDKNVYSQIAKRDSLDCQALAESVGSTRQKVAFAVARLGRRGFLS